MTKNPDFNKIFKEFERSLSEDSSKKDMESVVQKLAQSHKIEKSKLRGFFKNKLFIRLSDKMSIDKLTFLNIEHLKEAGIIGFKFIESDSKKILKQSISLATRFGFKKSFSEKGIRTANEGDSVQFLFVARAILAGFNCSNVDLRSSKYDAVIDYNSILLRVQVKGIALGSSISFMTRARGGGGIDYRHERNQPVRITKKDCDLYVAVNKETESCYIIPMRWADKQKKTSFSPGSPQIKQFEENWSIIEEIASQLKSK